MQGSPSGHHPGWGPWHRPGWTARCLFPSLRALGMTVDAMHAAGAFLVVDGKGAAVPGHAPGGAKVDHFFLDVEGTPVTTCMGAAVGLQLAARISLDSFLVDADVISPGSDKGQVRPGNGGHTAVGAAVKLELELVRETQACEARPGTPWSFRSRAPACRNRPIRNGTHPGSGRGSQVRP